jgi:histidinol dehydrogenase
MIPLYETVDDFLTSRNAESAIGGIPTDVLARAGSIVERVRLEGDQALVSLAEELDGIRLNEGQLRVARSVIDSSANEAPQSIRGVLERAHDNIRSYHEKQKELAWRAVQDDGTLLGQKVTPLMNVGVYVPGGKAVYPSSLLMNCIPAQIAGVERIVVATPPGIVEGCPALAYAIQMLGISEIVQVGGAQAIAALAFGTESIPRVDKVVGPGNAYVAAAKKLVVGQVGIDNIAGPSEIAVLADEKADARFIAADLLSQAEHGSGEERTVLVTPSLRLVHRVRRELERQLESLPRRSEIEQVLNDHGACILVPDMNDGVSLVDIIAPEHLEILSEDAEHLAEKVRNAGAIFIGEFSPVPVGDFYAGPNHVLPTGGTARYASPLGVYDFVKRTSLIRYSQGRLTCDRESIEAFARAEGFEAHARAISIRFED